MYFIHSSALINANEGVRHESRGECHGFKILSTVLSMTLVYSSLVARAAGPSYSP